MNFLKRAFMSVYAKKGKSLLQLFVFSVICILVLAGLSIQTASDKSADLARKQLGASVTLQEDMEKGREQLRESMEAGERPSFSRTLVSLEDAEQLAAYEQIKGYNFFLSTTAAASDFNSVENETDSNAGQSVMRQGPDAPGGGMMSMGDISLQGVAFTDSAEDFMDGNSSITEGRHLGKEDIGQNTAVIEETLASQNELTVGDSITVSDPAEENNTLTLEIVGLYETTSTGSDMAMNFQALNPYNTVYVPYTAAAAFSGDESSIDSAIYYLDDPENIDAFIEQAKSESSIDFDTYTLNSNDQLYKQMMGPIENVASFSKNVVYIVSIAGAIILGLIVMLSIRERKFEMGVLLALGEKRWKLIGQFITEILVIAVLSLGISVAAGNVVADQIADVLLEQQTETNEAAQQPPSFSGPGGGFNFGMGQGGPGEMQNAQNAETIDELDVQVTGKDIGVLTGIGVLIAILAALIPSLTVLRLQPKTILTRQD